MVCKDGENEFSESLERDSAAEKGNCSLKKRLLLILIVSDSQTDCGAELKALFGLAAGRESREWRRGFWIIQRRRACS